MSGWVLLQCSIRGSTDLGDRFGGFPGSRQLDTVCAMGSFWGSIHLRTEDRELVRQVVEHLSSSQGLKFYVGPAIKGWVAIYPQDNGQDTRVSQQIASDTSLDTFHLILHDSDLFIYRFYRGRELLDEYVSQPGYFPKSDSASEETLTGNPARYADLLKRPLLEVKELLARRSVGLPVEMERIAKFAKAVGLSNVETAYEYLEEPEAAGVKYRRQFIHIPDKGSEKLAGRERGRQRKELLKQLKREHFLLGTYTAGKAGQWVNWAAGRNGFLLHRCEFTKGTPILTVAPPWPVRPMPLPAEFPEDVSTFALSESGEQIALRRHVERSDVELWSVPQRKRVSQIQKVSGQFFFGARDSYLVETDGDRTRVVRLADGSTVREIATETAISAVAHPLGNAVLINQQVNLLYVALPDGPTHEIYLGGKSLLAQKYLGKLHQRFAAIDLAECERELRNHLTERSERLVEAVAADRRALGFAPEKDEIAARVQQEMEEQIASSLEGIRRAKWGKRYPAAQAAEGAANLKLSHNGNMVFCATGLGLRVFEWNEITSGKEDLLRAKYAFARPLRNANGVEYPCQFYGFAEDVLRHRLLFGGADGVLYFMDLRDGTVHSFLEMPERALIAQVEVTRDSSAVGCYCHPDESLTSQHLRARPHVLYVWNLNHLSAA